MIEIGHIWFGPALQRTTAATEAIYLLAAHAFDDLGYRRLEWKCNALNAASRRAAERFGFTLRRCLPQPHGDQGSQPRHRLVRDHRLRTGRRSGAGFQAWLAPGNFDDGGAQRQALSDLIASQKSRAV